ncbi:hypothetical protein Tco_1435391 [Tanacetum coccineum]
MVPDNENESDSEHETDENELGSESHQDENEEDIGDDDEKEVKDESVKTPSNNSDDKDETNITDKAEGDEDEEMDYTTNILNTDVEIVSLMDVHVHHEVPNQQTPTLLTVHVSAITDSLLVYSTVIPQSLPSFTPPPQQSTSTPPPTTEDDPLKTQVTALVDEHLDARLGATTDEFMNYLSASITARITEQVKNQQP